MDREQILIDGITLLQEKNRNRRKQLKHYKQMHEKDLKKIEQLNKEKELIIKHYDEEVKLYYDIIKEAIDYVEHISNVDIDWHEQDRIVNILRRVDNE